jgi:hypothetical protein
MSIVACLLLYSHFTHLLSMLIHVFVCNNKSQVQYSFQRVFDEYTSQKAVFDTVAMPLVEDVLHGKNGNYLFTSSITLVPSNNFQKNLFVSMEVPENEKQIIRLTNRQLISY